MRRPGLILYIALLPIQLVAEPLFQNSVASNDLDFIRPDDPGACWSIAQRGGGRTEMYDPRRDILFFDDARHVDVTFADQIIRINLHPDVGDPLARASAVAAALSRLPTQMRSELLYVNVLDGDGTAWSEDLGRFFTLYDGLIARRLADHDLDETVFHETAHVALDPFIANDPEWQANQRADQGFITEYAADKPDTEDVAESALFAWTMTHHPGRLPTEIEAAARQIMPNRLAYLGNILTAYLPPACAS